MPDLPDYYTQVIGVEAEAYSIRGGADVSKPAAPEAKDVYLATDTDRLWYCVADGAWRSYFISGRLLTANSLLFATADYTPAALSVAASRIVGRAAAGNIAALTGAQVMALLSGQAGANFAMNAKKITGVADPTLAQDAMTLAYADANYEDAGDVAAHALLTTGIHGVGAGAIVGTTLAQVLTNKTLTSPTINGTIATTGLTLPAFTLSGAVTGGGQTLLGLGQTSVKSASYPVLLAERTSAVTNAVRSVLYIKHKTTGDMVDGFGVDFNFLIQDDTETKAIAVLEAVRDGADNTGKFRFQVYNAGAMNLAATIDADGKLWADNGFDADGGTTDNLPVTPADVTGSRALDTEYQNTSGRPLLVIVSVQNGATALNTYGGRAKIGSASPPTTIAAQAKTYFDPTATGQWDGCVVFIVPDDWYYTVNDIGGAATQLDYWLEYPLFA